MVEYKCDKCGKTFSKKSSFIKHTNRKKSCVETDNNCICLLCDKKFSRPDVLRKHMNNPNIHNDIDMMKIKIAELQMKLNKTNTNTQVNNIDGSNNTAINNMVNSNIDNSKIDNSVKVENVYINIVPYGKEDKTFMTDDEILHFLFMGVMSIPELVKFIHFNKDKPEFHNIYISNIKSNFAKRYDGLKWNICDKNDAIEEEYMRACDFLENMYIEYKEKGMLGELTKTKMDKFIIRKDNKDYVEKMAAKILMILYNNRDIVEETIRKNKQLGR